MDKNSELLNELYQNTKMGGEAIERLLPSVDDEKFRQDLVTQRQGYSSLSEKAKEQLMRKNEKLYDVGPIAKIMTASGVKMNTLLDKSPSHIAEMTIQGSTMGIITATEELNRYTDVEEPVRQLASEIVQFEQNNIERLKGYL